MPIVLAAVDATPAGRPVLEMATAVAALVDATPKAINIRQDGSETVDALAAITDVPVRFAEGPVIETLVAAMAHPDVVIGVVGARRTLQGRRPLGSVARAIVERVSKPVVVVSPENGRMRSHTIKRLLVPLEGTEASSQSILDDLWPLVHNDDVELIVLHVLTADTVPRVLDRPARDEELMGAEFLARNCPVATGIELRNGPVASCVLDMCHESDADLVVLSWSQDSSPGHAAVVKEVLERSRAPVLLLPVATVSS